MKTRNFQQSKSAATLRRIQWDKMQNPAHMISHPDMLCPEGMGKEVSGRFGVDQAFVVVYDYKYVLKQLPELSESIPSSLVAGSEAYLKALRLALEEYQSNQKIETWADVVKTIRGRLKMKRLELAALVGVSDSTIGSWETSYSFNPCNLVSIASLLALIKTSDKELVEKAKQVAVAGYQSKLSSLI